MIYPYADFLIDFDRKHGGYVHANSPENSRVAVIIEARPFFFLPKVIRNTMFFLGSRWNLHVFTSEISHAYVQESLKDWRVGITKMSGVGRLSVNDYNKILTSRVFWEGFAEEKILVFQSDSLLAGSNVEDFERYDFVGAPCGRFDEQFVINGGLSLRSRRVMIDSLSRYAAPADVPEDVFFTAVLRQMGASLPDLDTAAGFSVESKYVRHPFGVHGTDKCYHGVDVALRITSAIRF
jgi:hypothetical protein